MMKQECSTGSNPFIVSLSLREKVSIARSIRKQIRFEKKLIFEDGYAVIENTPERLIGFHLQSLAANHGAEYLSGFIKKFFDHRPKNKKLSVLDVGGANETFLKKLSQNLGRKIDGTFTSLIDFSDSRGKGETDYKYVRMCAEFPPHRFYQAFDVVSSINGPLTWTRYPKLVTDNLIKMVKPGGVIFLSTDIGEHKDFDLYQSVMFHYPDFSMPLIVKIDEQKQTTIGFLFAQFN